MDTSILFVWICNLERCKGYMRQATDDVKIDKLLSLLRHLYNHALLPAPDTVAEYKSLIYPVLGGQL